MNNFINRLIICECHQDKHRILFISIPLVEKELTILNFFPKIILNRPDLNRLLDKIHSVLINYLYEFFFFQVFLLVILKIIKALSPATSSILL